MQEKEALKVIFFDIDGTLLDSSGAGRAAFVNALHSVFGWTDDIGYIQFSGATDLDVLNQIFERYGRELQDSDIASFFGQLPLELEQSVARHEVSALPGVVDLLERLSAEDKCRAGLITGNIESCARIKLEAAGIDHDFVLGAFGHEHADRNEIARLGLARAEQMLDAQECIGEIFLVGDSPADVAAAHAIGAHAIAVATGHPGSDQLAAAGADTVLADLSDTDAVMREALKVVESR